MMKNKIIFSLLLAPISFGQVAIQDLDPLTTPASGDVMYIEDVSDTTESSSGTGKSITPAGTEINTPY